MTEQELKKLGKRDLLSIVEKQEEEIERLSRELEETKTVLESGDIPLRTPGSLMEAARGINSIFAEAQKAVDEYL